MSVATANTAGHTKKVTTNAFLLIGYCLGNFIGLFFFLAKQAPQYELGVGMMFFCIGIQVALYCRNLGAALGKEQVKGGYFKLVIDQVLDIGLLE
ncbi:uncharacterized protein K460DRAFT_417614 [Cucurbitaria berberidis CBS 394.84]|uniref:Uncharacterized protein n=1 Tax=Cucurbitaria berberidis CBS 394.84 TaxID=1168544 RepID=A0A9P4L8Z8_9PLEO|nr:uncharacterized protein K460DRAFT_417614 [Cucurbitaria berberidis CBS 394.84]KAF1846560.1 hypothetical protein K460DRAFT_417614 [Cucurbitaria berberidis CBS 394.84]